MTIPMPQSTRVHWLTRSGLPHYADLPTDREWFWVLDSSWPALMAMFAARGAIEAWCTLDAPPPHRVLDYIDRIKD